MKEKELKIVEKQHIETLKDTPIVFTGIIQDLTTPIEFVNFLSIDPNVKEVILPTTEPVKFSEVPAITDTATVFPEVAGVSVSLPPLANQKQSL